MAKTATKTRAKRTGENKHYIGRTAEGFLIPRPDFKPVSFTLSQLEKAVRAAKLRQAEKQAG